MWSIVSAYTFWAFDGGIYWNNAIYWINYETEFHCKLDMVDYPMVTNIQSPALDNVVHTHTKLFESRGSLLLLMNEGFFRYHVFEMREEASKWSIRYIVDDPSFLVPGFKHEYTCCGGRIYTVSELGEPPDDHHVLISHKPVGLEQNAIPAVGWIKGCERKKNRAFRDYRREGKRGRQKYDANAHQDEETVAWIPCYILSKEGHFDTVCPNEDQRQTNEHPHQDNKDTEVTHSSSSEDFTIIV
ncbi:hypothetical protein Tco_0836389 [Tanacetum coccineum]